MQDRHTYKYAVIRFLPRVEREEFFNVGVILFCKRLKFLKVKYEINPAKLKAFSSEMDAETILEYLNSWKSICEGNPNAGPIATIEMSEKFGWLAACRSTVIQSSGTHAGLCVDPEKELELLFEMYVK